jgi:hypothetical protein
MGRRDDLPPIELVTPPPGDRTGPPPVRSQPSVFRTATGRSRRGDDGWWRWALALAVVIAVVAGVLVSDRRDRSEPDPDVAATTIAPSTPTPTTTAGVREGRASIPRGLSGTLYALTADATLAEVDLAGGRTRLASLSFGVAPWLVTQVVALEQVVLIATRRQVYSVDRATLLEQTLVADGRWIVAPPGGAWAALVPFGGASGEVTVLDGTGAPAAGGTLRLPAGVSVQGAVGAGLVLDVAGTVQVWRLDGTAGPVIGTGRFVAAGDTAVARIRCSDLTCAVTTGTLARPDAVVVPGLAVTTAWYFGPSAAFDPTGTRLAALSVDEAGRPTVRLATVDPATPVAIADATLPPSTPGPLPAPSFSADGSAVLYPSSGGIALWRPSAGGGRSGGRTDELRLGDGRTLALTVTPQPPPPPPQSSGPPPSFA